MNLFLSWIIKDFLWKTFGGYFLKILSRIIKDSLKDFKEVSLDQFRFVFFLVLFLLPKNSFRQRLNFQLTPVELNFCKTFILVQMKKYCIQCSIDWIKQIFLNAKYNIKVQDSLLNIKIWTLCRWWRSIVLLFHVLNNE